VLNTSRIESPYSRWRNSAAAVTGILVFIIVGGWLAITKTTISSDMQQFLPAKSKSAPISNIDPLKVLNIINQANSGLFLFAIEGGTDKQRATASIQLRKKLLKDEKFVFVNNGKGTLAKKDRNILNQYRYLLTENADYSENSLVKALQVRYQELTSPLGAFFKSSINSDPTAEVRAILKQWQLGKEPTKLHSVWFSNNKDTALLVAGIKINGADINAQQRAVDIIKDNFSAINNNGLKLAISGTGVFAVQARTKIKSESQRISVIASIAVMLLMLFAFRSVWLVFLAAIPLLCAIISGVIVTQVIFGSIQGITLAFGLTLIGVALDYPVHIFSHIVKSENIKTSINNIWPTMRLGVITTSLGFLALTQTNFNGLAQLGVFAVAGLLTAAVVSRFVLADLILLRPVRIKEVVPAWVGWISQVSISFNVINVSLFTSVAGALIFMYPVNWESDLTKLSPISAEQVTLDTRLRKQLNADDLVNVLIVRASSSNAVLKKSEQLAASLEKMVNDKTIAGYRAPHHLLPSIETQKLRQQNLPNSDILNQRVNKAIQESNFRPGSFSAYIKDVEESKTLAPLDREKIQGTILDRQLASMLFRQKDEWFAVIRFIGVSESAVLEQQLNKLGDDDLAYINIKQVSQSAVDDFRNEALKLIAIGLLVIFITLIVSLRDSQRLMRVCFIVSMALVFDIIWLNILDQALSLFHLISLLLVLGLGLDYSLFYTRSVDTKSVRERTAYGMLVCFGSTALVFGMLATSSIPVLNAIGLTVFIGVSFNYILATFFSTKSIT